MSSYVHPETQCLHTTRLLRKKSSKPKWMDPVRVSGPAGRPLSPAGQLTACVRVTPQFIGESPAYVVEESIVDPRNKTMLTFTKNITLTRYMVVEETCLFRPNPEDPQGCVALAGWRGSGPQHRRVGSPGDRSSTLRAMGCKVSSPMFTMGSVVEKFGFDRFQRHKDAVGGRVVVRRCVATSRPRLTRPFCAARQARDGLHHVLQRLQKEGQLMYGRLRLPLARCLPGEAPTARPGADKQH